MKFVLLKFVLLSVMSAQCFVTYATVLRAVLMRLIRSSHTVHNSSADVKVSSSYIYAYIYMHSCTADVYGMQQHVSHMLFTALSA
jgi:hypothetical protein